MGAYDTPPTGEAIHLTAGGVVTNGQNGSDLGRIIGQGTLVDIGGGSGIVTNFGTIESAGSDFTYGVFLRDGGSVTNGETGSAGGLIVGGTGVSIGGKVRNDYDVHQPRDPNYPTVYSVYSRLGRRNDGFPLGDF